MKLFLAFLFLSISSTGFCRQSSLDSLVQKITTDKVDSVKALDLNRAGFICLKDGDYKNSLDYYLRSLQLYEKLDNKAEVSASSRRVGQVYDRLFEFNKAIDYINRAIRFQEKAGDKYKLCLCYRDLAVVYAHQFNYPKALAFHTKSLQLAEELGNKDEMAETSVQIGLLFQSQLDRTKALDYLSRALKIYTELKKQKEISSCYTNIGLVYFDQKQYARALEFQQQALKIDEETGDIDGMSNDYTNIGLVFYEQKDYKKALDYFLKAMKIDESLDDVNAICINCTNIGSLYNRLGDYKQAFYYLKKGEELAIASGNIDNLMSIYAALSDMYKAQGNYKSAYENHVKFKALTDSLFNIENSKQLSDIKTQYEVDKKATELKAAEEKKEVVYKAEQAKKELEIKNQKNIRNSLLAGSFLLLVLVFFVFRNLRESRRSNTIITQQKHLIEEKQKEILDSINYAKRLQEAILPPAEFIDKYLPDNFILYQPKDVVAGDFYWAEAVNDLFFIAAADSTGHGVPGAMVSVVCSNALNRSLKEFNLIEPGRILDKTRELVLETFGKSSTEVKDGMDISLLCIDSKHERLSWSGANNPLWYIYNNELTELKADKQPIGKTDDPRPFTTHTLPFRKNTTFYLFTDGLADQFGGPQGKKYKYKPFAATLLQNHHKAPASQKEILAQTFTAWRGDLEQVDDVCVIGIKI